MGIHKNAVLMPTAHRVRIGPRRKRLLPLPSRQRLRGASAEPGELPLR